MIQFLNDGAVPSTVEMWAVLLWSALPILVIIFASRKF